MKHGKKALMHVPWIVMLLVLFWLAFFYTDEYGMTSWEHTQDLLGEDDWIGWIHPFGTEVSRAIQIGPYDSLDQCQSDAFDRLQRSFNDWKSAEYFCAYQCASQDHRLREKSCKVVRK